MQTTETNIQELLKPRVKIIALWPWCKQHNDMNDQPKVGDIFEVSPGGSIANNAMTIMHVDKYPHLFRKLQWFDERSLDDMPDHVRCISEFHKIIKEGRIYKVMSKGSFDDDMELNMRASKYWCFVEGYERRLNFSHFEPTTEAEYNSYLSSTSNKEV